LFFGRRPALPIGANDHERTAKLGQLGAQLTDLNPDGTVYRRYHLLIISQADDDQSSVTTAVADVLSRHLPSSRPQLVRAADKFSSRTRPQRIMAASRSPMSNLVSAEPLLNLENTAYSTIIPGELIKRVTASLPGC
jgi:hypothetical protein